MANFSYIQGKIYYGYGKAAEHLGVSHQIYRSTNGINPIQADNLIGSQLIGVDEDYTYKKAQKYGDPVWQILPEDGLSLENYDFLVGTTVTYFIVDIKPEDRLSPPLVVQCNASISSLINPVNALVPGKNPYQSLGGTGTSILLNCPCSILEKGRMDKDNMKLPSSVSMPYYNIILPDIDDIVINTGQILIDNIGRKMAVISAERTKKSLGFRIIASLEGT